MRRLDLPRFIRGYAAPGMPVLMAAVAIAWNRPTADRMRAQLAEIGVEVISTASGLEADAGGRFKAEDLAKAASLLGTLSALQMLNLSETHVEDLGPLKVRFPTKAATYSNRKPSTDSDLKPAGIPI